MKESGWIICSMYSGLCDGHGGSVVCGHLQVAVCVWRKTSVRTW